MYKSLWKVKVCPRPLNKEKTDFLNTIKNCHMKITGKDKVLLHYNSNEHTWLIMLKNK